MTDLTHRMRAVADHAAAAAQLPSAAEIGARGRRRRRHVLLGQALGVALLAAGTVGVISAVSQSSTESVDSGYAESVGLRPPVRPLDASVITRDPLNERPVEQLLVLAATTGTMDYYEYTRADGVTCHAFVPVAPVDEDGRLAGSSGCAPDEPSFSYGGFSNGDDMGRGQAFVAGHAPRGTRTVQLTGTDSSVRSAHVFDGGERPYDLWIADLGPRFTVNHLDALDSTGTVLARLDAP